jgi:hypothetical protein
MYKYTSELRADELGISYKSLPTREAYNLFFLFSHVYISPAI